MWADIEYMDGVRYGGGFFYLSLSEFAAYSRGISSCHSTCYCFFNLNFNLPHLFVSVCLSVCHTQTHTHTHKLQYRVFTLDPKNYPKDKMQALAKRLHDNGQKMGENGFGVYAQLHNTDIAH